MRKFVLLCGVLALLAAPGMAQNGTTPAAEIFGGYSYLRVNPGEGAEGINVPAGWNAAVEINANSWFAFVADFSGHYKDISVDSITANFNLHGFTFGPQFNYRGERMKGFFRALFGAARSSGDVTVPVDLQAIRAGGSQAQETISGSDTAFAMAVGGGVDVGASERIGFRLFQADYILTRFADTNQHNFRLSFGVVFRLGSRD